MKTSHDKFALLDGVRGVAALFVMTKHTKDFWGVFHPYRSYLAVDIFFLMSGFVIASAYDKKLRSGEMDGVRFMLRRLVRLYPMFLGSLALCAVLNAALLAGRGVHDEVRLLLSVALTALFLPSVMPGSPYLFPLNGAYWSLFFELISNALYGFWGRRLRTASLLGVVSVAAVLLARSALREGSLDNGMVWYLGGLVTGLARAVFGVILGVVLHRHRLALLEGLRSRLKFGVSPWIGFALLFSVLLAPRVSFGNWAVDLSAVFLVIPAGVLLCSQEIAQGLHRPMLLLGAISYPLYVFHSIVGEIVEHVLGKAAIVRAAPFDGLLLAGVLMVACLWLERVFDIPLRQSMTRAIARWYVPQPDGYRTR